MSKPKILGERYLQLAAAVMPEGATFGDTCKVARAIEAEALAEREACASIIDDHMLCGDDYVLEESLLPRKLNPGNKVGLAYSAAIRKRGEA